MAAASPGASSADSTPLGLVILADGHVTHGGRRLGAVIRGEPPKDKPERLQLACRACEKGLYAASARLFAAARGADPKFADDRRAQHRCNAACAAY